jgi:hypothetical protein
MTHEAYDNVTALGGRCWMGIGGDLVRMTGYAGWPLLSTVSYVFMTGSNGGVKGKELSGFVYSHLSST